MLARVTLFLTDKTTLHLHDMLGAAWLTTALRIHICSEINTTDCTKETAKEQEGVSLARVTPGHRKKKPRRKRHTPLSIVEHWSGSELNVQPPDDQTYCVCYGALSVAG